MRPLLSVENLSLEIDGIKLLNDVSFYYTKR